MYQNLEVFGYPDTEEHLEVLGYPTTEECLEVLGYPNMEEYLELLGYPVEMVGSQDVPSRSASCSGSTENADITVSRQIDKCPRATSTV